MSWTATIHISSKNPDGYMHVYGDINGDSKEEAKAGAQFIYDALANGKKRFLRCAPIVGEFSINRDAYPAFVRFSFCDEPGKEHLADEAYEVTFGLGAHHE